jgi:hypothetical protein
MIKPRYIFITDALLFSAALDVYFLNSLGEN